MTIISNELKQIEVPIDDLIKLNDKLGTIRAADNINENNKVYQIKGSDLTSLETKQKFKDKGIKNLVIEITPKIKKYLIDKYPERYADSELDSNVQLLEPDELEIGYFLREPVYDKQGKLLLNKWQVLKTYSINLIKNYGTKKSYEIYTYNNKTDVTEDFEKQLKQKNSLRLTTIDDQIFVTKIIETMLSEFSIEVQQINDPNSAIQKLKKFLPHIILLDINMPDLNGFQVLELIKKHNVLKNIPVIILSVRQSKQDVLKAMELGASDYLVKPFNCNIVLNRIKKFVSPEILPESMIKTAEKNEIDYDEIHKKIDDILEQI